MSFATEPAAIATQTVIESAQAAQEIALLAQQLGVLHEIENINKTIATGGGIIQGVLGSSLDVLKGISDEIKKAQETVAPIIALVVEVEKIGQIIKGDVGLNLSSLVDATKGISDTLKGSIGVNISDAITASGQRTADAITAHTDATKSVGQSIEAAAKAQADQAAKIAEAIHANSIWTHITDEQFKLAVGSTACPAWLAREEQASQFMRGIMASISKTGACLFELLYTPFIEALRDTITLPFQTASRVIFDELNKQFPVQEVDPRTVQEHGIQLMTEAFAVGLGAHVVAVAGEAAFPGQKNLGLGQIAALLVDVSGFAPIARAMVGEKITASLTIPMRFLAQRSFRPNLPSLRDALEGWARLGIADDDLKELLRWHGVPEAFHPMFFEVATHQLRFRDIALTFDNVEVDDAWLTRAIQKAGYRGETAIKMRDAIVAKSNHQHREGVVDEMRATVVDGLQSTTWLQANLRTLGFRPETIRLITTRTALQLARTHANDLAKVWQTKVEQEIITLDEFKLVLVGLGFRLDIVAVKVALVSAKLKGRVAREEKLEHQQAIKKAQTTRTQAALEAFRRGTIDADHLEVVLVGLGIVPDQAQAMVALERAKVIQKPKAPKTLKEDPTAQRILKARVDETLLRLHHDELSPEQALAMLVGLGEDPKLAEALVERELAKLKPPKPIAGLRG